MFLSISIKKDSATYQSVCLARLKHVVCARRLPDVTADIFPEPPALPN